MYDFLNNKIEAVTNAVTGEQNVDQNALQGSTTPKTTLWSVVLDEAIVANSKTLVPLKSTTYTTESAFRYMPPRAGEAKPNIQVLVINDCGDVEKDATSDFSSDLDQDVISVPLTRYSKSFGISMFDAMKGFEATAAQVATVVNKIKADITKDFATLLATTSNEVEVSEITPASVAHVVSAAFGDYGDAETLVLSPANYAQLTPDSALSLKLEDGAYGIGSIYKTAGLGEGVEGIVYNKDAVAAAFARPAWTQMPGIEIVEFEVDGIPFRMKIVADGDKNIIYHTVDVLAGFAIANSKHIAKVVKSA